MFEKCSIKAQKETNMKTAITIENKGKKEHEQ